MVAANMITLRAWGETSSWSSLPVWRPMQLEKRPSKCGPWPGRRETKFAAKIFSRSAWDVLSIRKALRQVPAAFRSVVVLREIEGFTYEEIADLLGVNLGTVKSRLMRGRAALREVLAPGGGSGEGTYE